MRGLGNSGDELIQEDYLELSVIDVCLHMHLSNIGVI